MADYSRIWILDLRDILGVFLNALSASLTKRGRRKYDGDQLDLGEEAPTFTSIAEVNKWIGAHRGPTLAEVPGAPGLYIYRERAVAAEATDKEDHLERVILDAVPRQRCDIVTHVQY